MIAVELVEFIPGLWVSALTCTAAACLTLWGAMRGVVQHRLPRLLLGVATVVIAGSYWVDIAGGSGGDMRRGASWLLWPALAMTAWSGVAYSRRVVAATAELIERRKCDGSA